jgi:hypothetical protein
MATPALSTVVHGSAVSLPHPSINGRVIKAAQYNPVRRAWIFTAFPTANV